MLRYDARLDLPAATTATTAGDYLDSLRFPPDARRMLFDVFAHSFFNPEDGDVGGRAPDDVPLLLHREPGGAGLRRARRAVLRSPSGGPLASATCRARACRSVTGPRGASVATRDGARLAASRSHGERALEADARRCSPLDVPALQAARRRVARRSTTRVPAAPSTGLDVTHPFAVLAAVARPAAARAAASPSSAPPAVGLARQHLALRRASRTRAAAWAQRTGRLGRRAPRLRRAEPGTTEAGPCARTPPARVPRPSIPSTRGRGSLEERFLLRRDCPAFAPGSYADRPARLPHPHEGVALAGDFVRLPLPSAPHGARGGVGLPGRQPPPRAPRREGRARVLDPAARDPGTARGRDRSESNAMSALWRFGPPLPPGRDPGGRPRPPRTGSRPSRRRSPAP
ncbi:MAG: hypothetical protein MZW92_28180 [Comamonadaceae bacterium]|nr:hypothetical protein [Comamonadaceae bacterium]